MTTENQGQVQATGMDPKQEVFKGLAAVLYASEAPVSGSYVDQSRMLAAAADAVQPLDKKSVLDIGCGFGTTTMAIARHCPWMITSIDSSEQHIALLRHVLQTEDDTATFLERLGAREVLGEAFGPTLRHLGEMRREFRGGLFRARGGVHDAFTCSALDLSSQREGVYEAVIGNNFLHWPVNQRQMMILEENAPLSRDHAFELAWKGVMDEVSRVLVRKGIVAFLEPKDFVGANDDPTLERLCEERATVSHPAIVALQKEVNRCLEERHGIVRQVTTVFPLFRRREMNRLFCIAGYRLERSTMYEMTSACPALDYAYVRLPMQLGQVDLPFHDKLVIMRESLDCVRKTLSEDVQRMPVRAQFFIWVARKQ